MRPENWEACFDRYIAEFEREIKGKPILFPGMLEALQTLASKGIRLAVVSGKTKKAVDIALEEMDLTHLFDPIIGGWRGGERKAQDINAVLKDWELRAKDVAYIGDTCGDIHAA